MNSTVRGLFRLMRVHQWVKNLFIFAAVIFGGCVGNFALDIRAFVAMISFCLLSSSVYALNDIMDRQFDKLSEERLDRPLANGSLSVRAAIVAALVSSASAFMLDTFLLAGDGALVMVAYLVLNVAYSLWLKHITVVDVITVALGYVLRVVMGGVVCGIPLTGWILVMVFFLTLFIALAKRRHEVLLLRSIDPKNVRRSLRGYSMSVIDISLKALVAILLIGYLIYTVSPRPSGGRDYWLVLTAVPVGYGLWRYLRLALADAGTGAPSRLVVRDTYLRLTVIVWLLVFIVLIY